MREVKNDLIIGITFSILSIFSLLYLIPVWVETPPYLSAASVGPDFWPYTIVSVCYVISFAMVLANIKQIPKLKVNINIKRILMLLLVSVVFSLYYLSIPILGFIISTILLCTFLILMSNPEPTTFKRSLNATVVSTVFTLVIYYIFTNIAQTQFPTGFLGV